MNVPDCYYRVSVKALILDEQKRFLLMKEYNGKWELPGGGLDFGENPQNAIRRELIEEMGLNVTYVANTPSYFVTSRMDDSENWCAIALYVTEVENYDFTKSDECQEIGFFTTKEAIKLPLFIKAKAFVEIYDPKNHNF